MPELSEELSRARRAIDGLLGVEKIGKWSWNEVSERWVLPVSIRHGLAATQFIPEVTKWQVVINDSYLEGTIDIFPATSDSIEITFPHQRYNTSNSKSGFRTGSICLTGPSHSLRRLGEKEPIENSSRRLIWRIERLREWIIRAAKSTLVLEGDPFELPDFPNAENSLISFAFQEELSTIRNWEGQVKFGFARIRLSPNKKLLLVDSFYIKKEPPVQVLDWGKMGEISGFANIAIWIKLTNIPVLEPWHPPSTFAELRAVLNKEAINLDSLISNFANKFPKELRQGKPVVGLVGFPIPQKVGDKASSIHWQAVFLPPPSLENSSGFRNSESSLSLRDKVAVFNKPNPLEWLRSENWSENNLLTRGSFMEDFRRKQITIIGVGALGSAVAELLVRGGCERIILIDPDKFRAGNATRHVLELSDAGEEKAKALANRLSLVRPTVQVEAITKNLFNLNEDEKELALESSVIIDITANDEVILWAERNLKALDSTFVSLALGWEAKKLFCFASPSKIFSTNIFSKLIEPWMQLERKSRKPDNDLPREGIGCWSVVFPARADDVWLLASTAIKWVENLFKSSKSISVQLSVFEQVFDKNNSFIGLQLVDQQTE